MIIICAWCKRNIGEKEPLDDKRVTHSICPECADKEREAEEELDDAPTWHEWTPRNAMRTPYGLCKGFDRDNRGGGGRSDF